MAHITVNLTELQAGEIAHKLSIVRDEPDLQDSYEITDAQADALYESVPTKGGAFTFDPMYRDMITEELENCLDIADANLERGDVSYLSYIKSIRGAIKKLRAA